MLTEKQVKKFQEKFKEKDLLPDFFNALSDKTRYRIFTMISKYHNLCVTDVATVLQITMSAASQQLKILEEVGLIERERVGQSICFEVRKKDARVRSVMKLMQKKQLFRP